MEKNIPEQFENEFNSEKYLNEIMLKYPLARIAIRQQVKTIKETIIKSEEAKEYWIKKLQEENE